MYNLLIVDDESMVRLGMKSCVDWERLQVDNVYEASNGEEGLQAVQDHKIVFPFWKSCRNWSPHPRPL